MYNKYIKYKTKYINFKRKNSKFTNITDSYNKDVINIFKKLNIKQDLLNDNTTKRSTFNRDSKLANNKIFGSKLSRVLGKKIYNYEKVLQNIKDDSRLPIYLEFQSNENIHNVANNYYHFLYACLFPLLEFIIFNYKFINYNKCILYIITDITNFEKIINSLAVHIKNFYDVNLEIKKIENLFSRRYLNYSEILQLQYNNNIKYISKQKEGIIHIYLPSYDNFIGDLYYDKNYRQLQKNSLTKIKLFLNDCLKYISVNPTFINKKIIIIYRNPEKVNTRWIQNMDILKQHLDEIDEDIFILKDMPSFLEQYYLFKNADIVIAQHGAGLANIIFMNELKRVYELSTPISNICCPSNVEINNDKIINVKTGNRSDLFPKSHYINLSLFNNLKYSFLGILLHDEIETLRSQDMDFIKETIQSEKTTLEGLDKYILNYINNEIIYNSFIWNYTIQQMLYRNYNIEHPFNNSDFDTFKKFCCSIYHNNKIKMLCSENNLE
jgi:hypothetical protein